MKMKLLKKILTIFLPLTMVISSCNGANNKGKPRENLPDITIKQENFETPSHDDDEMHEIDMGDADSFRSTFRDVSPNFTFGLKSSGTRLLSSFTTDASFLEINDANAEGVNYTASLDNGTNMLTVEPDTPYTPGQAYSVQLHVEAYKFYVGGSLDSSIRTIYFTVKEEDKNEMELVEGISTYPLENVLQNSDPLEPHPYLIYKGDISLKEGDVVKFENNDSKDEYKNDTIYIKVQSLS